MKKKNNNKIISFLPKKLNKFKQIELTCANTEAKRDSFNSNEIRQDLTYTDIAELIRKHIPKGSRILELGGGGMPQVSYLLHNEYEIYFSDFSEDLVKLSRRRLLFNKVKNIKYFVLDAEKIPFKDNYFDAVYICSALHHLPDNDKAMKEMRRVTKKHGIIIITHEPNRLTFTLMQRIIRIIKKILRIKRHNSNFSIADYNLEGYTLKSFKRFSTNLNLKILEIRKHEIAAGFYEHFLEYLEQIIGKTIKRRLHKTCNRLDKVLIHIPIINKFFWVWSIIYEK